MFEFPQIGETIETQRVPPNAFGIFLHEEFKNCQERNPTLPEKDIKRELGRFWLTSNDEFKEKYREHARMIRDKFKQDNPGFVEKPTKRKIAISLERYPRPANIKVIIDQEAAIKSVAISDQNHANFVNSDQSKSHSIDLSMH
jgi:hypothetical protein